MIWHLYLSFQNDGFLVEVNRDEHPCTTGDFSGTGMFFIVVMMNGNETLIEYLKCIRVIDGKPLVYYNN